MTENCRWLLSAGLGETLGDGHATYGNGAAQAFGYDGISRLSSLTANLAGTASDLTKTFAYNPASQIITETRSNDAYAQAIANDTQTTVTNGLNQLSTVNGTAATYDGRGNMTSDPVTGKSYSYLPSNTSSTISPARSRRWNMTRSTGWPTSATAASSPIM